MKTKKYKGDHLCECVVDIEYKSNPHLIKCKNKAVLIYFRDDNKRRSDFGVLMCLDCWTKYEKKHGGNIKRKYGHE